MYLTDLAFIEEGTPNYTEDGLVNFSKMRMVSGPAPLLRAGGDGSERCGCAHPVPSPQPAVARTAPGGRARPPARTGSQGCPW